MQATGKVAPADTNPYAVQLAACAPDQSAYELPRAALGGTHGALTAALVEVLRSPQVGGLSWREVIEVVRPAVLDVVASLSGSTSWSSSSPTSHAAVNFGCCGNYQSLCGVSPDDQPVADAVRASASIPFFFRPFRMQVDKAAVTGGHSEILCTDGGMLSNFPIDIFDRTDAKVPRWPTLGVKLSAQQQSINPGWQPNPGPLELAKSLISTMTNAHDQMHISDPSFSSRTIFVDTTGFKATDFHLTDADKRTLFDNGTAAGTAFLSTWDWEAWKAQYNETGSAPTL